MPTAKKPGRPKGAKTQARETADAQITACSRCGSTDRTPYKSRRELCHGGIDPKTGAAYTHTVWRNTECAACGQARVDIHRENRTDNPSEPGPHD